MTDENLENNKVGMVRYLLAKLHGHERLDEQRHIQEKEALEKQAKEYERRLDFLNGEAERLRCMQETYLPRELYNTEYDRIRNDVEDLIKYRATMEGKASQNSVYLAYAITIILFFIDRFLK